MHKRFLLSMGIFCSFARCQAQEQIDLSAKHVCGWNKEVTQKTVWAFATGEDDSVRIYVREICQREALDYSFGVMAANVDNVIATIDNGQRYIYYSRAFFDNLPSHWYKLAILAHEIGHHINNNVTGSDEDRRPEQELAADRFAGKVLCEFGAPRAVIRQLLVETCSEKGSAFYPDRSARLEAFLDGYAIAGCHSSPAPMPSPRTDPPTKIPGYNAFSLQKTFRHFPYEVCLNDKHHLMLNDHLPGQNVAVADMLADNVIKTFPGRDYGFAINNSDHVLIATRPSEDSVVVFDYTSGKPLHFFRAYGMESHIRFSPGDRFLGVQDYDKFHLYDLTTNKSITSLTVDGYGRSNGDFCFSPDGKFLAISAKQGILLYSLETLAVVRKIALPENPWGFQFIPHKDQMVWSSGENYFRIMDLNGKQLREIKFIEKESELTEIEKETGSDDGPAVFALAVSPDAKYIAASGGTSGRIRIFTMQGNAVQTIRFEHKSAVQDLRFTSDGKYLISAGGTGADFTRVYRNF